MEELFLSPGTAGAVALVLGLLAVVLLSVIAARLSRVIDLLDELAEMFTTEAKQAPGEIGQTEQASSSASR